MNAAKEHQEQNNTREIHFNSNNLRLPPLFTKKPPSRMNFCRLHTRQSAVRSALPIQIISDQPQGDIINKQGRTTTSKLPAQR
jgi:hypothetical protein